MSVCILPSHYYVAEYKGARFRVRAIDFACNLGLWWCEECRTGQRIFVPASAFREKDSVAWRSCGRPEANLTTK
jgi:hypothetical protein